MSVAMVLVVAETSLAALLERRIPPPNCSQDSRPHELLLALPPTSVCDSTTSRIKDALMLLFSPRTTRAQPTLVSRPQGCTFARCGEDRLTFPPCAHRGISRNSNLLYPLSTLRSSGISRLPAVDPAADSVKQTI